MSAGSMEAIVAGSREEHTALAAELLARAIQSAVDERGVARVALSGGTISSDTLRPTGPPPGTPSVMLMGAQASSGAREASEDSEESA